MPTKKPEPGRVIKSRADLLTEGVRRPSVVVRPQCVLLVIDRSGSMAGSPIAEATAAARDLVSILADPKEKDAFSIALVTFADVAAVDAPLTKASRFRMPSPTADGLTSFNAATGACLRVLETAPPAENAARPCIVFMTDGRDEGSNADPLQHVPALKQAADVVCVAFGAHADLGFLGRLASGPEFVTTASSGIELRAYFTSVAQSLSASRASGGLVSAGIDPFASRRV